MIKAVTPKSSHFCLQEAVIFSRGSLTISFSLGEAGLVFGTAAGCSWKSFRLHVHAKPSIVWHFFGILKGTEFLISNNFAR